MPLLTDEQCAFYQENGYLIIRQLVDLETIAELRAALMGVVTGEDQDVRRKLPVTWKDGTKVVKIDRVYRADPVILNYVETSRLGQAAAELMQTHEVRLFYDQVIYKEPTIGGAVPCHQDYDYWRHISTDNMVTGWTALGKSTVENGCVYVIPGSHKWGLIDCMGFRLLSDPDPESLIKNCLDGERKNTLTRVPLMLEPGDVSFHHCLTIHCSYPNTTSEARLGYIQHYLPGEARYHAERDIQKHHEIDVEDGDLIRGKHFPLMWPH